MWDQYYYQHQDIDQESTNAAGLTWDDQHPPSLDVQDIDFDLDLDLVSDSSSSQQRDVYPRFPPPPAYRSVSPVSFKDRSDAADHHHHLHPQGSANSSLSPKVHPVTNAATATAVGVKTTPDTTPKITINTTSTAKKKRSSVIATSISSFKADSKKNLLWAAHPARSISNPSSTSPPTSRAPPSVLSTTPGMTYHQRLTQSGPHEAYNSVNSTHAPPLFASIPTVIPIEGTYREPPMSHHTQPLYQFPQLHSNYPGQSSLSGGIPHHVGPHGLSSSAPTDHTESWAAAMTSRAPPGASSASSWAYPGSVGGGGVNVGAGQNTAGGLRYASEETVAELTKEEKRARRKEQNRLAQQDLRRRRMEHTSNLETKVEELIGMLDKKDTEIRMLQDIVKQLQRDGKTAPGVNEVLNGSTLLNVPHEEEWMTHSNPSTSFNPPVSPIQGMRPLSARPMSSSVGPVNGRDTARRASDVKGDGKGKPGTIGHLQSPGYSPVPLTMPTSGMIHGRSGPHGRTGPSEGYPGRFQGNPIGPGMRNPAGGHLWSAPAGTVDFPAEIHQGYGQISPVAGRRPSSVCYTGMEGHSGHKMGGGAAGPMIAGPSHYSPGMPSYSKSAAVHPHHDNLGLNGMGSIKSHPAIEYHQQPTFPQSIGSTDTIGMSDARETGDSCPSDLTTNSGLPSLSDVEDAVNVNQVVPPGYEPKSNQEGVFVYPGGGLFNGGATNETRVGGGGAQ